mmetsp:Transcript_9027/g.6367  ORF Transcript_9027/g.6367 Transcript_9027/m.6367 type:complete len:117 (+) Transcript_9027:16-366(+)
MEVKNGRKFVSAVLITEFFGTAGLVMAFNLSNGVGACTPGTLFAIIIVTAMISGGHANPAVTIAVFIERKKFCSNFCYMLAIIVVQMLGGFMALFILYHIRIIFLIETDKYTMVPG